MGAEPDAVALSADGSALYVGLDGTSELAKLALPAMTDVGRAGIGAGLIAATIAVSPADPDVVAVSRADRNVLPSQPGPVLFRGLVAQPKTLNEGGNLLVFDAAATPLYALPPQPPPATPFPLQPPTTTL